MEEQKRTLAEMLLSIKAVRLQPDNPFTWASGWLSPIYCDNRKVNSYPEVRTYVKEQLAAIIREQFPDVEAVAGVATGAISQGALVADLLNLPFAYVRPKPKDHGMGNQIEGELKEATKVVVVEDLISTGGSSLKAVEALKAAGMEVLGMVASYTYGFPQAEEAFEKAGVRLITITDYEHVVQQAAATGYISPSDVEILRQWRKAPQEWGKS
ncbi:MAG: orotate phosphoribosyltransferase [Prevotella sp.]|nr:orotate phosphoribosyltransferase [Prevotella sp.]